MTQEVWGTFSVRDHCAPNAFVADVLIYDRLVLPVPADDRERARWRRPNANDPRETWDPDRLQALIEILGSQRRPRRDDAKLVWEVDWDRDKWIYERSRLEAAGVVSDDAFWTTRRIIAMDDAVPGVVEAVAAYPSAAACVQDRELQQVNVSPNPPGTIGAVIARPLLLPDPGKETKLHPLRQAIELALDDDFRAARGAYYDWVREFFAPLQGRDGTRPVDAASLELAREKLNDLLAKERAVVKKHGSAKRWRRVTEAFTIIGLGAAGVGAVLAGGNPPGLVEASAGILGWVTGRLAPPPSDRPPLTGASMFATSERRLDWLKQ